MKNKYRVILNNKNLAGYFHRTFGVSDDHKIENIRNMARTTARTYPFLNLLIEAWENVDQNDKDFGKIETGFQITFSSAPKTIKIRNFKKINGEKRIGTFQKTFHIQNGDNYFNVENNEVVDHFVNTTWLPDYKVK